MRYFILLMILVICYLLIHLYYSFCQHLPLWGKIAVMIGLSAAVLLSFGLHPAEWLLNIHFSPSIKLILNIAVAFFITLAFLYIFTDILKLVHLYPSAWKSHEATDGFILAAISLILCIGGYVNNMHPTAMNYEIRNDKISKDFTIAVISDIHIGSENMTPKKLTKAIEIINSRDPDIVIIAGDIFDGRSPEKTFITDNYGDILSKLKAKQGVYAITGNHEYYMASPKKELSLFKQTGIKLLQDETIFIKPLNTYLIGREDAAKSTRYGDKVSPLQNIMPKGDGLKIVLSHNPNTIKESIANGADLQISGHTHNGQLFPINFILKFMYETAWGIKQIGDTTLFVTSGLGMWGPPVRTTSVSEIAFITLKPDSSHQ